MMKQIVLLILITIAQFSISQELKELRHFHTADFKCDFYISFSEKEIKYEDTLHYHWFKSQAIHVTQGNSEGNVLDGSYTKFYISGQMAEQGSFDKGLRDGTWKSWYESGNLKTIYNYSNGLLAGNYSLYNESGDVRETGKIKRGEKEVVEEKRKKTKKEKKIRIGETKVDPEKVKKREEKAQIREYERAKRREEKGGGFFERWFRFDKNDKPDKKKKEKKEKSEKREASRYLSDGDKDNAA